MLYRHNSGWSKQAGEEGSDWPTVCHSFHPRASMISDPQVQGLRPSTTRLEDRQNINQQTM